MASLQGLVWYSSELGHARNIFQMQKEYELNVDKKEYPDFLGWLYDMERSGVYSCKDMTDRFEPFTVPVSELGWCPICGNCSWNNNPDWDGSAYTEERVCDACGSTFVEVYEYAHTMLTRIGG